MALLCNRWTIWTYPCRIRWLGWIGLRCSLSYLNLLDRGSICLLLRGTLLGTGPSLLLDLLSIAPLLLLWLMLLVLLWLLDLLGRGGGGTWWPRFSLLSLPPFLCLLIRMRGGLLLRIPMGLLPVCLPSCSMLLRRCRGGLPRSVLLGIPSLGTWGLPTKGSGDRTTRVWYRSLYPFRLDLLHGLLCLLCASTWGTTLPLLCLGWWGCLSTCVPWPGLSSVWGAWTLSLFWKLG